MNILVIARRMNEIGGGAERSMNNLINLMKNNHNIFLFNYSNIEKGMVGNVYNWKMPELFKKVYIPKQLKFHLNQIYSKGTIKKYIKRINPELIIYQKPPIPQRVANIPTIAFVRDLEYIEYFASQKRKTPKGKLSLMIEKAIGRKIIKELKKMDMVIVNSEYIKSKLGDLGIDSCVIYPFIETEKYTDLKWEPKYIAYISGSLAIHKGYMIFENIARNMPNVNFILAGRDPDNLTKNIPSNVNYVGWVDNIENILKMTRILLVPSLWKEPFGRIVIEAQSVGIPVVASNVGGLPEAVGNGGITIDDYCNVQVWCESINRIINDKMLQTTLIENAKQNAKKFDMNILYNRFKQIVNDKLGIEL
ncbi:hypothetical protein DRQ33_06600 [bacterium]|nr:MAG: hypothetical protein DRQ33_06600 [bacterium]